MDADQRKRARTLAERQTEMRERLAKEKLKSVADRLVVDAVKHTPAEPLPVVQLAAVDWNRVLSRTDEEIPMKRQKAPPIEARLLSLDEAGFYLGVSPSTVRRFVGMGELPGVRLPGKGERGRILVDIRDLEHFIEKNKKRATEDRAYWWRRGY
jgi:excisionase family DNA binding protein